MLRAIFCLLAVSAGLQAWAAERQFDFSKVPLNQMPPGFRSVVAGQGKPGEWRIVLDDAPAPAAPAAEPAKIPVLAQLSRDITDEHFPILIFDDEAFGDFTFTTKFKTVSGAIEQMAGIVFRYQDENNYYYVRASSLGNTFRFFKIVGGQRSAPLGPEIQIPKGVWHELAVTCQANQIHCLLNGKEVIPVMTDNSFTSGKIGFWTKSDSVSHFTDARITYTPHLILAKILVETTLKRYPRLLGMQIYAFNKGKTVPEIVASTAEAEIGTLGGKTEQDIIQRDVTYFGRTPQTVVVTMPLHDRNGETIAAVRFMMKSFAGQTEQNAIVRALPMVKEMEARIRSAKDLLE